MRKYLLALLAAVLAAGVAAPAAWAANEWLTYHHDAARSGIDPDATQPVTPALAWQSPDLGAPIWSQPLVYHQLAYVATVGDELYALNVSTGQIVWQASAGTPVPASELPCGDIKPTVGIVGTPQIDLATDTIYAVADTWNSQSKQAAHVLEGFNLQTGQRTMEVPVDPPGADTKALLNRTALTLDGGRLYFGYGGNDGDCSDYQGAVVSVPESGGSATFWQDHPAAPAISGGPIWAPEGLVVDGAGRLYAATGNPDPKPKATTYDYSDSVIELDPGSSFSADPAASPNPFGWFEPPSWEADSNSDLDLGSAGPMLLPNGLLFETGKRGQGYLIETATMAQGAKALFEGKGCDSGGSWGGDTYFEGVIYVSCSGGLTALRLSLSPPSFSELWHGPADAYGPPIISGGHVWALATGGTGGGGTKLYGLNPATGATEVTETLPSQIADHFGSPSAAGGRLFVSTGSTVTAYQIAQIIAEPAEAPAPAPTPIGAPAPSKGAPGAKGTPGATTPAKKKKAHKKQKKASAKKPGKKGKASPHHGVAATHVSLRSRHLRVGRHGRVRVPLGCEPAGASCSGSVEIATRISRGHATVRRRRDAARRAVHRSLHLIGTGSFQGASRTFAVSVRPNALGRELVAGHRRLRVIVSVKLAGGRGVRAKGTLQARRFAHHRVPLRR